MNKDLKERIKQKRDEIAKMQERLDWHARRGRPDGTTEHDIMRRLKRELDQLLLEAKDG